MPNPLSQMLSTPSTAAKPKAVQQEVNEAKESVPFHTFVDSEASVKSHATEEADLVAQDIDAEAELEAEPEGGDTTINSATSDDKPQPKVRKFAPEIVQGTAAAPQSTTPPGLPIAIKPVDKMVREDHSETRQIETLQSLNKQVRRDVLPAFEALVMGSEQPSTTPEATTKSTTSLMVSGNVISLPKELSEPSTFARRVSEEPQAPLVQNTSSRSPTTIDHAPTVVQMRLSVSEKLSLETGTPLVPEVEDIQGVKESSVLNATRDSGSPVQTTTAVARAETTRAIATQMVTAISTRPASGAVEVALNPEELGRVSIILNGRDDGLHLTITAERPETLDMMRRNLAILEAEFKNLGLGDLSVDLGTSTDAQHDETAENDDTQLASPNPEHTIDADPAPPRMRPDGRIDMRL